MCQLMMIPTYSLAENVIDAELITWIFLWGIPSQKTHPPRMSTWLSNVLARLTLGWVTVRQKCHYAIGSGISLKYTREINVKIYITVIQRLNFCRFKNFNGRKNKRWVQSVIFRLP